MKKWKKIKLAESNVERDYISEEKIEKLLGNEVWVCVEVSNSNMHRGLMFTRNSKIQNEKDLRKINNTFGSENLQSRMKFC